MSDSVPGFKVPLLHLVELDGRGRCLASSVIDVDAYTARTLVPTGRGRLADPADLGPLMSWFATEAGVPRVTS